MPNENENIIQLGPLADAQRREKQTTMTTNNHHTENPHYRTDDRPGWKFIEEMETQYERLNARAEARFEEECIQLSRPLDKPPKVNEV